MNGVSRVIRDRLYLSFAEGRLIVCINVAGVDFTNAQKQNSSIWKYKNQVLKRVAIHFFQILWSNIAFFVINKRKSGRNQLFNLIFRHAGQDFTATLVTALLDSYFKPHLPMRLLSL
jgi:uncharacterized membrane protein